jgi:pyruvate-formate lyase-activating enzyme
MKVQEIAQHERLKPQKLSARETPHATIEPNTTCNIRCAYCYCIEEAAMKPLAQVIEEIDLAIAKRNLDAISLLGGEPTLHPDLVEIVRYVKSKGLVCIVLTNGVRFLRDGDDALLDALVAAGTDRFLVHIDQGQKHVHGDIERARHRIFDMLDARRVCYGLSMTLYPGQEKEIPRVMKEHARHPYFDGLLCTLAFDLDHAFDRKPSVHPQPSMADVYRGIGEGLGIEPSAYVPSSTDDDEVCDVRAVAGAQSRIQVALPQGEGARVLRRDDEPVVDAAVACGHGCGGARDAPAQGGRAGALDARRPRQLGPALSLHRGPAGPAL